MSADVNEAILLVDMKDDHARLQRIVTVAQLAYEWAKARRARLTFGPVRRALCTHVEEEYEGTCVDRLRDGAMLEPCAQCTATLERMAEKKLLAAKLSGLSARLERACLGPREKKGTSDV